LHISHARLAADACYHACYYLGLVEKYGLTQDTFRSFYDMFLPTPTYFAAARLRNLVQHTLVKVTNEFDVAGGRELALINLCMKRPCKRHLLLYVEVICKTTGATQYHCACTSLHAPLTSASPGLATHRTRDMLPPMALPFSADCSFDFMQAFM
tara:strand:- start:227 stop:688 length:462 start_codon:yes stop_codon:yes gene_type:complete